MNCNEIESEIQKKGLTAPRVKPADIDAAIADTEIVKFVSKSGQVLRWAVMTMKNGYAVVGKPSCSASPENDDPEIGEKIATDNTRNEIWALEGYLLKQRLFIEQNPWMCSDCGVSFSGFPKECPHGDKRCTDLLKQGK
jgi:hypothetical protein